MIYGIKLFEDSESKRESDYDVTILLKKMLYSQLKYENEYLRKACQSIICNVKYSSYNENVNEIQKIENKQKAFHKRQKTHINFNHIQNLELNIDEINKETESNTSLITVVETNKVPYYH